MIKSRILFLFKKFFPYLHLSFWIIYNRNKYHTLRNILVYPAFNNIKNLSDIYFRLIWALPNYLRKPLTISIVVQKNLENINLEELKCPYYLFNSKLNSSIKLIPETGLLNVKDYNLILLSDKSLLFKFTIKRLLKKTIVIDPEYCLTFEATVWKNGLFYLSDQEEKKAYRQISSRNYDDFIKTHSTKDICYCFLPGPSFDNYKNLDVLDGALKIICNSTIINDDFLDYIKGPDLIAFADEVFHLGPSLYAASFRERLLKVVQKYKCHVIIPEEAMPLFLSYFSELRNYLIGIKTKGSINFPSPKNLKVKNTSNIFTLFMLPIASYLSNKIIIIGADGRDKNDNYFWKYSKQAQFNDELMKTALIAHPSFFKDINYSFYYKRHIRYLSKLIKYGEKRGIKYYSATYSKIPCLKKRFKLI